MEGLVGKRTDAPYAAGLASGWVKWCERHTAEGVIIGVTGGRPAAQALVLGRPAGGRMRAVGVSLPLPQQVRLTVAPLLHAAGEEMSVFPMTPLWTVSSLSAQVTTPNWPRRPG
jgi:hypothetical protein